jgi:excisionase family DNA binding protein
MKSVGIMADGVVTTATAAQRLGVSRYTISRMIQRGDIVGWVKPGTTVNRGVTVESLNSALRRLARQ